MANLLSLDNKVFASYVFYCGVLALKVFLVVFMTVYYRITKKVFPSEEDYRADPKKEKVVGIKTDPDVERTRRIHANDLENIPFFLTLGLLYVLTDPVHSTAIIVFRVFCGARIMHTFGYFFGLPPIRGPSFLVGLFCNIFLAVNIICATKMAY